METERSFVQSFGDNKVIKPSILIHLHVKIWMNYQ